MLNKRIQLIPEIPQNAKDILIPVFENETEACKDVEFLSDFSSDIFSGKFKEKISWINKNGQHISLLGLGKREMLHKCHHAFRNYAFQEGKKNKAVYVCMPGNSNEIIYQCGLGLGLSTYNISFFKESVDDKSASYFIEYKKDNAGAAKVLEDSLMAAETEKSIMRLVDYPPNHKTPKFLAKWAIESGKSYGYDVQVIEGEDIQKNDLHALWAVGKGSEHPPCFIIMDYKPGNFSEETHTIGLVGKGITFDSGGISIKPARNMHYMKSDMGGSAAVFGAVELAAKLKLNIRVIGIVPSAENSVDKKSFRPGDVIKSYSGKTIEVIDTDAEGRLVLADGLAYLQKNYEVDTLVDLATLTGSVVRALGYHAAGLFTNNEDLRTAIKKAGDITNNRVWSLPLWDEYKSEMNSDIADIKNLGSSPVAGSITAAKFLEFFVSDHPNWAHIDIAGVAFGDSAYSKMKSASGFGPRMLVQLMKHLISTHQ
jgi:leucyl aminopeptidase